jgi:FkbM family methyltransferase
MATQNDEDQYLPEGDGTYLDIGSYDGKLFSNVRPLAERGWKGVCVEPAAHAFAKLLDDPPPGAKLVHAAIAPRTGLVSFMQSTDYCVSTTDRAHAERWKNDTTYVPTFTVGITVADLLKDFPGPFRLISIDTEGTSVWVFHELAPRLDELECEVVIVEHDGSLLHAPGFKEVHRTPENSILQRVA